MIIHEEKINSDLKGTIIDLETIGNFNNFSDSRRYKDIVPVIFGFVNNKKLQIVCAKNEKSIPLLKKKLEEIMPKLKRPFYAFQSEFERGVLFHFLNKKVKFNFELNNEKFEKKEFVVNYLKIPQYGDPFQGNGLMCMRSWVSGDIKKSIEHNRSCLLKEKDILKMRGHRKPDFLEYRL